MANKITGINRQVGRYYNIYKKPFDATYGPWESWDDFYLNILYGGVLNIFEESTEEERIAELNNNVDPGLTIAFIEDGKVVEYWNPVAGQGFVKKSSGDGASSEEITEIKQIIEDNEYVTADALNDLNSRIIYLEDFIREHGAGGGNTILVDLPKGITKEYVYNGNNQTFEWDSEWLEKNGTYCIITNDKYKNAGAHTVTVSLNFDSGLKYWKDGTTTPKTLNFTIKPCVINSADVTLDNYSVPFGSKPNITSVSANNNQFTGLVEGTDYTATASSTNVGTSHFNLTFKGNFTGTLSSSDYQIVKANKNFMFTSTETSVPYGDNLTIKTNANTTYDGTVTYSIISGNEYATINPTTGEITTILYKKGSFVVRATVGESSSYNYNTNVIEKTIEIAKPTKIFGHWGLDVKNEPTDAIPSNSIVMNFVNNSYTMYQSEYNSKFGVKLYDVWYFCIPNNVEINGKLIDGALPLESKDYLKEYTITDDFGIVYNVYGKSGGVLGDLVMIVNIRNK